MFEHINFDILFNEATYQNNEKKETSAKSKVILNGANNSAMDKSINNCKEINTSSSGTIQMDDLIRMNVLHEQLQLPTSNQLYQHSLNNLNSELNAAQLQNNSVNLQLSPPFQQLNLQQISCLEQKLSKENNLDFFTSIDQHNPLLYQAIRDITFISILILILFYKLRHLFHNIILNFESSWKVLVTFERELDSSFSQENFLNFLQNEFVEQRNANLKRAEHLKQEVSQLEKIVKIMDKEIESEVYRLVQMQNQKSFQFVTTTSRNQYTFTSNDFKASKSGRPCPECGKVFRNAYKLNRHLYVHKDPSEKPYVCDWTNCTYRSISRNDLNRHKMIHTGEKPYLCDIEGCDKRYSRPDKLRHHKQTIHFKEARKKEQICIWPGCNFQCVFKSELNRHQMLHNLPKGASTTDGDNKDKGKGANSKLPGDYSTAFSIVSTTVANSQHNNHMLPIPSAALMLANNNLNSSAMHTINMNLVNTRLSTHLTLPSTAIVSSDNRVVQNNSDSCTNSSTAPVSSSTGTNHRLSTISVWSS